MGLTPYLKLQSVPIALFLVLSFFILDFRKKKLTDILIYIVFGLLPTILLLIYLWVNDQVQNFYKFYIEMNLGYGDKGSFGRSLFNTFFVRSLNEVSISYFLKTIYFLLSVFLSIILITDKFKNKLLGFSVMLNWVVIYSVAAPGFSYSHYFTYLMLSFPIALGCIFLWWNKMGFSKGISLAIYSVLLISMVVYHIREAYNSKYFDNLLVKVQNFSSNKIFVSELGHELISIGQRIPGKPQLVSFDWNPEIHIETKLVQGTHLIVPERMFGYQVPEKESVDFSKGIFLEDLKKNKPEIITVPTNTSKSYFDFTYKSFDKIPEVKSYFDSNYTKFKQVDSVDIFLRNDLMIKFSKNPS